MFEHVVGYVASGNRCDESEHITCCSASSIVEVCIYLNMWSGTSHRATGVMNLTLVLCCVTSNRSGHKVLDVSAEQGKTIEQTHSSECLSLVFIVYCSLCL